MLELNPEKNKLTFPQRQLTENYRALVYACTPWLLFCFRGFSYNEINVFVCFYYFSYNDIIPMGDNIRKTSLDKYHAIYER